MVEPYLFFNGNCAEAIDFYEKAFGGTDKKVMRFKDAPPMPGQNLPEVFEDYIMHGEMTIADTRFSFSDNIELVTHIHKDAAGHKVAMGSMVALIVRCDDPEDVLRYFESLKSSGTIHQEPGPQFFSRMYGFVTDKFGVSWQLICE